jgi:hypothetical protein
MMIRPGIVLGWQLGKWAEHAEITEWAARGEDVSVPVTRTPRNEYVISLNWFPLIPVSGFEYPMDSFYPEGWRFCFSILPYRWGNNKLGFKFEYGMLVNTVRHVNYNYWTNGEWVDGIWVDGHWVDEYERSDIDWLNHFSFGFLYQRVLSDNWQVNAHIGFCLSNSYDYLFSALPAMNFGASFQFFFGNVVFLEAGLDGAVLFTFEEEKRNRFILRPGISIGLQIYRNNEPGLRLRGSGFQR